MQQQAANKKKSKFIYTVNTPEVPLGKLSIGLHNATTLWRRFNTSQSGLGIL